MCTPPPNNLSMPRPIFFKYGTCIMQSLAEFYIILLEEHLHIALETLEVRICFSL
jgi:hypothetical protein